MEVNGKDDDLKTPLLNPSDAVAIDDSLPFNWQTKHFHSSPVDLGKLCDRSTSTTENPLTSFLPHPQKQAAAVWPGS